MGPRAVRATAGSLLRRSITSQHAWILLSAASILSWWLAPGHTPAGFRQGSLDHSLLYGGVYRARWLKLSGSMVVSRTTFAPVPTQSRPYHDSAGDIRRYRRANRRSEGRRVGKEWRSRGG